MKILPKSLLALAILCACAIANAQTLAIRGARIVPSAGPAIAKGNVVIQGDKIAAVGENAEIPAEAQTIDGTGLTVYPGLIDAYCLAGVAAPPGAPAPPTAQQNQGRQQGQRGRGQGGRQGAAQSPPP